MIILATELRSIYEQIAKASTYGVVSVLVFIPYNVDSIAAKSILFELFKKDDILCQYTFVKGYADLDAKMKTHISEETLPQTVIFINCAGSVSLIRRYEGVFTEDHVAYIIDSHRPIHTENIDARVENVRVFDVSRLIDETLTQEEAALDEGFSDPASIQAYALATENGLSNSQVLWFAILGLTEHFTLGHIDNARYETLLEIITNEVSRLSNGKPFTIIYDDDRSEDVIRPDNGIQVPVFQDFAIASSTELRCPMLRQWTLYESLCASSFIVSRLRMWTQRGNDNFLQLLALTGIPIKVAKQTFIIMDKEIKDSLVDRFDRYIDSFNLAGFTFPSFTLHRGFEIELAASDVVNALRAQLCSDKPENMQMIDSFSGMRFLSNAELLHSSIEAAKKRVKLITSYGMNLMSRRKATIINSHKYWCVTIRDAVDRGFPIQPQIIVELGLFLLQALDAEFEKGGARPIVIAMLDETKENFLVVAVSPLFEFSDAQQTHFGLLFKRASEDSGIEISADSFDSFVCKVPADNLPLFFDTLSGLIVRELTE